MHGKVDGRWINGLMDGWVSRVVLVCRWMGIFVGGMMVR